MFELLLALSLNGSFFYDTVPDSLKEEAALNCSNARHVVDELLKVVGADLDIDGVGGLNSHTG